MSTPTDNKGEIDGRPVTWYYQRAENDQEGRLSWAEGRVTCEYVPWAERFEITIHCSPGSATFKVSYQIISAIVSNNDQHQTLSGRMSNLTT
jgi:hypothetical protein